MTTTEAQRITVVGPNLPREAKATFHAHAEGCADLSKGWIKNYTRDAWTFEATSLTDVVYEIHSDFIDDNDCDPVEDFMGEVHFAPCVHLPYKTAVA